MPGVLSSRPEFGRSRAAGRAGRVASILALTLGLGSGGALLLVNMVDSSPDCAKATVLRVTAAPNVAGALRGLVDDYNRADHDAAGSCVQVQLTGQDPGTTYDRLSSGWPDAAAGPMPDVWIPDSTAWLNLARSVAAAARLLPTGGPVIASSPVVIGSPAPVATALAGSGVKLSWANLAGWAGDPTFWRGRGHASWGPFSVSFAVPASSVATAQAISAISAASAAPAASAASAARTGGSAAALTPDVLANNVTVRTAVGAFERAAARIEPSTDALLDGLRTAPPIATDAVTNAGAPLFDAAPMMESDLIAYNQRITAAAPGATGPGPATPSATPLTAVYPTDGLYRQSVPYLLLPLAAGEPKKAAAAADLLAHLRGGEGRTALARAGFRDPDGAAGPGFPGAAAGARAATGPMSPGLSAGPDVAAVRLLFDSVQRRSATLLVVDASASMAAAVPGSNPPRDRLRLALDSLSSALAFLAEDDEAGVWSFASAPGSTGSTGGAIHRELSPMAAVGAADPTFGTHRQQLESVGAELRPGGGSPLHQATLDAFRQLNANYRPGFANTVLLITDEGPGASAGADPLSLADLLADLRSEYDPNRPVHVITIAYGPDADRAPLAAVAAATGGRSYAAPDPNLLPRVLVDAVADAR
jgi:Ca-activated chloride channel homolog